jgi:hypothetical protein
MASNIRVLVSNLGDGNWGAGADTSNVTTSNETIFFPRNSNASASFRFAGNEDYIGWASKTNWLIQVDNRGGGNATIQVLGHRPSGVTEELVAATVLGASVSLSQGGVGGEEIYGPFTHFSFVASSNSGALHCFVTAWNYGDILDAGA